MKEKIIELLKENQSLSVEEIFSSFGETSSSDFKDLVKEINTLVEEYLIIENKQGNYSLIENTNFLTGTLDLKEKGFGFVIPDNKDQDDIFIGKDKVFDAMNKDRVLVYISKKRLGFRQEGEIRKVIERRFKYIIGTIDKKQNHSYLKCDDKTIKQKIIIKDRDLLGATHFDKVKCEITNYAFKGKIECKVIQVIGKENDPFIDMISKLIKYDIDPYFSAEVLNEAEKLSFIYDEKTSKRIDLRDDLIITIDGDDAKDFDDAVGLKINERGNYVLTVSIADVSHYVTRGSILDEEAYKRGTSVYFPRLVTPMLPEKLSNDLCSLKPNVERLTQTCEMEISKSGKVVNYNIYESVIKSKYRMTYTNVNLIFDEDKETILEYKEIFPMLHEMKKLAKALNDIRSSEGSINFETEESYIKMDDQGKAVDVLLRSRGISENIIEEFMLLANKIVAEHIFWLNLPFIYRIHEKPKPEKLERLLKMTQALGFKVKAKNEISNHELQKLLANIEGTQYEKGINLLVLRSMQKAVYSSENIGHYGLGFKFYTHFTSPIRRYPDLIVHRLLREYLYNEVQSTDVINYYQSVMKDIASDTSKKEYNAMIVSREVDDMKKAEYMSKYINKKFDGIISSVTPFGLYVSLPNTVEGLVHISSLHDDFYHYEESLLILVGERTKNIYRIGDNVKVQLVGVNIPDGEIDFKILRWDNNENNRTK